jgi:hypothetical protein
MNDQAPDANEILMGGGGAPTAKFVEGVPFGGAIVAKPRAHQEREYDPKNPGHGALKYFPSGDKIMGITVDVQTNERMAGDAEDTGVRRIYIEGKRLKDATRAAIRASGAAGLEVGGELYVTQTGREPDENGRITDQSPKLWDVRYVPAATAALNGPPNNGMVTQAPPSPAMTQTAAGVATAFGPATTAPQYPPPAQAAPAQAAPQYPPAQGAPQYPQYPPAQAPAAQYPPAQAAPAPVNAPAGGPSPEAIAALRAAGVDPATVYPGYVG